MSAQLSPPEKGPKRDRKGTEKGPKGTEKGPERDRKGTEKQNMLKHVVFDTKEGIETEPQNVPENR